MVAWWVRQTQRFHGGELVLELLAFFELLASVFELLASVFAKRFIVYRVVNLHEQRDISQKVQKVNKDFAVG
jgi:hypothetical protein